MGTAPLPACGPEAKGRIFVRWVSWVALRPFVGAARRFLADAGFMLRPFEIARLVGIRRTTRCPSPAPDGGVSERVLIYRWVRASWFFAPSFGVAAISASC